MVLPLMEDAVDVMAVMGLKGVLIKSFFEQEMVLPIMSALRTSCKKIPWPTVSMILF